MISQYPKTVKQELDVLQNQFLLLFLKYKLGFRYSHESLDKIPSLLGKEKLFLAHCFMHAVFGNSTEQDPQIRIETKKIRQQYFLEISSSGNPATFAKAMEEYCDDFLLKEHLRLSLLNAELPQELKDRIEVEPDLFSKGSRIRLRINQVKS